MSDELWARIDPYLPVHPLGCHRPRVDNHKVLNGIFFVLRTGVPWKALDATGLCSGSTAHARLQDWTQAGVFERLWVDSLLEYDQEKKLAWKWQSMDGALTKAPLGGEKTGPNPTDRAKLGTKRSLLTDAKGISVGLVVAGANVHDMRLVEATLGSIPQEVEALRLAHLSRTLQHLWLDKGYDYDEVRELADAFGYEVDLRTRGEEATAKRHRRGKPRSWVVERTHSWLNRYRRILVRWEKRAANYQAMLHFACASLIWNKCLFE